MDTDLKMFLFGVLIGGTIIMILYFVAMNPMVDKITRYNPEDIKNCNRLASQFNEMRIGIPMANLTDRVNVGELWFYCECTTGSDAHEVFYSDVIASQNGSQLMTTEILCTPRY